MLREAVNGHNSLSCTQASCVWPFFLCPLQPPPMVAIPTGLEGQSYNSSFCVQDSFFQDQFWHLS